MPFGVCSFQLQEKIQGRTISMQAKRNYLTDSASMDQIKRDFNWKFHF